MKKTALFLVIIVLLLCSCGKKQDSNNLEFPKTTWGMSVEETLNSYEITKEDTSLYNETGRGTVFVIEGYEVFGEKTSKIIFNFIDFEDNKNMELCEVKVTYPESVDMNRVLENMQKLYGKKTVSDIITYDLYQATEELRERSYTESQQVKIWADRPIAEFIPEKESENYRELWEPFQPNLKKENWESFCKNSRMIRAFWKNEEEGKTLEFNAYNLLVYEELKRQLSK